VLTLANSAYYGFSGQVRSIHDAITLLGTAMIRSLVTHAGVNQLFLFEGHRHRFSGYELWKHSVGTGAAAKVIAEILQQPTPEDFFTLGVLHDIGFIIEYQFYRQTFHEMLMLLNKPHDRLIIDFERDFFEKHHGEFTSMFCNHWKLPSEFQTGILYHHNPLEAPPQDRLAASILFLADKHVNHLQYGFHYSAAGIETSQEFEVKRFIQNDPINHPEFSSRFAHELEAISHFFA
jgi:HD-like signal output (HDOD) protein